MTYSAELTPRNERLLLLTLAGIQFSHVLDFMIMMPLGPVLMRAFGIGTHEFGLLVASYSFSAAVSGILAATFIDLFERKRVLLTCFGNKGSVMIGRVDGSSQELARRLLL